MTEYKYEVYSDGDLLWVGYNLAEAYEVMRRLVGDAELKQRMVETRTGYLYL